MWTENLINAVYTSKLKKKSHVFDIEKPQIRKATITNANSYKYFWTANGKVLVKENDTALVIAIQNESDVNKTT